MAKASKMWNTALRVLRKLSPITHVYHTQYVRKWKDHTSTWLQMTTEVFFMISKCLKQPSCPSSNQKTVRMTSLFYNHSINIEIKNEWAVGSCNNLNKSCMQFTKWKRNGCNAAFDPKCAKLWESRATEVDRLWWKVCMLRRLIKSQHSHSHWDYK